MRDDILARIRAANRRSGAPSAAEREAVQARLRSHPRGPLPTIAGELVPRFRERCLTLLSTVDEIASLDQAPAAIARYLNDQRLPLAGACWPQFADLGWRDAGLSLEPRPARGDDKVAVTGSYCAIAETGTLMLLSGENEHATTSLLPDTHIAIMSASRIVRSMEDAWDLLRRERGTLPRQVNFISGPSRTADIEMTLVMGAHGPFRVHVLVVMD
ncbi:MAG: LutC/YkgG family protein [Burkholderiales bacterium]